MNTPPTITEETETTLHSVDAPPTAAAGATLRLMNTPSTAAEGATLNPVDQQVAVRSEPGSAKYEKHAENETQ